MTDKKSFTVDVPEDFVPRFASIFRPFDMMGVKKYSCSFLAEQLPEELADTLGAYSPHSGWRSYLKERAGVRYATATSRTPPVVLPGRLQTNTDLIYWKSLLELCDLTGMPREWVFRERRLRLLVEPFDWHHYSFGKGRALALKAVQVLDLDEGFIRREMRRRLDEMQ